MADEMRNAVVLLSGGLDSTTVLAIALERGFAVHALTIDYGQRQRIEIECAQRLAKEMGAKSHRTLALDLASFGGSALTDDEIAVPKDREDSDITSGIPVTYVPARNLVFLSVAAAFAESIGAEDIFIGINAVDYSGYPDCRPEFIEAFENAARLGTKAGVEGTAHLQVHAPLSGMSKAEIIRAGSRLGVDYSRTHSCYDPAPDGRACGRCDACLLRKRGFAEAKLPDPTAYVEGE